MVPRFEDSFQPSAILPVENVEYRTWLEQLAGMKNSTNQVRYHSEADRHVKLLKITPDQSVTLFDLMS